MHLSLSLYIYIYIYIHTMSAEKQLFSREPLLCNPPAETNPTPKPNNCWVALCV